MTFSYSQISQFLRCPRSYRFRYLDGWREKESRAALCFGRAFEKALAAFFERENAGAVLFKEWGAYREVPLEYSHGDDWERMLRQEIALLEQFARDNRIRVRQPKRNTQKKIVRSLSHGNDFVAYVDAIVQLDGTRRLLEWKTSSARYPEQPEGLTSLDLQLVCYSRITGIPDVAIVAFVRNAFRRFNTCRLRSQKNREGNLASWWMRRSVKLKLPSSLLIPESVSRRTGASAALTSDSA